MDEKQKKNFYLKILYLYEKYELNNNPCDMEIISEAIEVLEDRLHF